MLLRIFTQNNRGLSIAFPVIAFGIMTFLFGFWPSSSSHSLTYASDYLFENFFESPLVKILLGGSVISIISWLLNNTFNNNELYFQPSYFIGILCVIILPFSFYHLQQWSWLISQFFIACGLQFGIQIFKQKRVFAFVFLAQIMFGTAMCLFPQNMGIMLMIPCTLLINRPANAKEILLSLFSFFFPLLYWISYAYLNNIENEWYFFCSLSQPLNGAKWFESIAFWMTILSLLLSITSLFKKENRQTTKTQQAKSTLIILFICVLIGFIVCVIIKEPFTAFNMCIPYIMICGYYWTHYRVSLLSPIIFYSWLLIFILFGIHLIH